MTKLVRIPLAWPIGTRTGGSTSKDPYIKNGTLERYGELNYVLKRPGTSSVTTLGSGGASQGIDFFNNTFYGVVADTLYSSSTQTNSGADGTAWTQTIAPAWAATEGQGAVVFQDRMWMIGGATASAGIWSTQDGKKWAVNAGGQPWGFRLDMGCVVFDNKIFVVGGLNTTLSSTFADVWSSPDGTHWTSLTTAAGWTPRFRHMAIATNNGIYIMGGQDAIGGNYLNDVWYSADGTTWAQIKIVAPWSVRASSSIFWYNNQIWIVGGQTSGGGALNDAWYSPDGITWTQSTAAAFSGGGRYQSYFCVYANLMWNIGGSLPAATNEIYVSSNGITWFLDAGPAGLTPRRLGQALVFQTPTSISANHYPTIWLLGGDTGATAVAEVWYANLNTNAAASYPLTPDTASASFQFTTYQNGTRFLLKNSSNFYVLQSGTLTRVVDPNYPPETVPGLVVLNAFAYVMTPGGEIHACKLDDATAWPSLQFITADYEDDPGICLAKYLNYVVALGQYTTQFFYDNGANQPVGSPLAPYITANLRVGCVAAATVASAANTLVWVAQTKQLARTVVMMNGLVPQTISTPYVDKILAVTTVSDLAGFGFSIGGHQYYALKVGATDALVYDFTFQEWYEWDTFSYGAFVTNFTTGNCLLFSVTGGHLVKLDPAVYTDTLGGNFSFEVQTLKVDFGNNAFKYWGDVTVIADRSSATPTIYTTDDDYQTYTNHGTVDLSLARPQINRTGMSRRRAWKYVQADNYPARLEHLEDAYSQGES